MPIMEQMKLDEASLTRQPEEVFDILNKLGEGSYGSVYKAIHKDSRQVLAIKQVPVDTDLQEIIKEISIMQQCDSPYVVKYYGSYFKNTDLWIVMEYCGAGSVLDIMKLRGIYHSLPRGDVLTLSEEEIATILCDTLKGLEYLHLRKKIHRDIKAGNILLNSEGHAKLADFGVAGQLTDTMAKRNTVIGTPFWMAPEVIQEIGYDCVADIWSLGITSLEMAEGKAPYAEIHPMRAIFMIPSKPPPSFNKPDQWSSQFIDFVTRCLVKNPEERATASQLLQHDFIRIQARQPEILADIIREAQDMREKLAENAVSSSDDTSGNPGTMVPDSDQTLVRNSGDATGVTDNGTMINHPTLVPETRQRTMTDIESDLGTMVINENDDDEDGDDTMKRHDSKDYRPAFLDHFEKKDQQGNNSSDPKVEQSPSGPAVEQGHKSTAASVNPALQRQLEQIAGGQHVVGGQAVPAPSVPGVPSSDAADNNAAKFQKSLLDGDLEFLKYLSYDELTFRMANLDQDMEREIDDLRRRYHAKRQPILDAMDQKRKRQQNF